MRTRSLLLVTIGYQSCGAPIYRVAVFSGYDCNGHAVYRYVTQTSLAHCGCNRKAPPRRSEAVAAPRHPHNINYRSGSGRNCTLNSSRYSSSRCR